MKNYHDLEQANRNMSDQNIDLLHSYEEKERQSKEHFEKWYVFTSIQFLHRVSTSYHILFSASFMKNKLRNTN